MSSTENPVRRRAHRATRACDFCNLRSIRCRPSDTNPASCQSCLEYGRRCAYERPTKKRGVRPTYETGAVLGPSPLSPAKAMSPQFMLPEYLTDGTLIALVFAFFDIVYPAIPCFSRRDLVDRISRADYRYDRSFYSMLLAICGLVCAYVRDGALCPVQASNIHTFMATDAGKFESLASNLIQKEPSTSVNFDHLRACALLAILSLQNKDIAGMKTFLAVYNMNVQLHGLVKECNWPVEMSDMERQDWRCLFWSVYMIEMFSVTCLDGTAVSRESQSDVCYPDELQSGTSIDSNSLPASHYEIPGNSPSADLASWKFAVNLCRILENAVDYQRSSAKTSAASARVAYYNLAHPPRAILEHMAQQYNALRQHLRNKSHLPTDSPVLGVQRYMERDIVLTIQLIRLMLFSQQSILPAERLDIGCEALELFRKLPSEHIKTMGAAFLHKFAFIGSMMVSPDQDPRSIRCQRTIAVLESFARVTRSLDPSALCAGHAGWHLRAFWELKTSNMPTQIPSQVPVAIETIDVADVIGRVSIGAPFTRASAEPNQEEEAGDFAQHLGAAELTFDHEQAELFGGGIGQHAQGWRFYFGT